MSEGKRKLINIWDKVAPRFGKIGPKYWNQFGNRLVELSSINRGAKILDVAMGRGASLFPAISKIGENGYAVGIDISEIMVSETYNDILEQQIGNVEVIKMDATNLEFDDNSFDNIICGFGIGYLLLSDNKLTEIIRMLKKNGQVSFSIWGIQEDQKWLTEIINKYIRTDSSNQNNNRKSDIPKFDTISDARKILESSGLRDVEVYQEDSDIVYKSKEEWWEEMCSNAVRVILEQIEELGADKLEECKIDIFNGLEKYKKIDGFHLSMPVIYAFGIK